MSEEIPEDTEYPDGRYEPVDEPLELETPQVDWFEKSDKQENLETPDARDSE